MPGLPPLDSPRPPPRAAPGRPARAARRAGVPADPPEVRDAMARKVADGGRLRQTRPNLVGALVRLGPGSTLPGGPDSGLDDATYARFVAAAFEAGPAGRVPGRGADDPLRFEPAPGSSRRRASSPGSPGGPARSPRSTPRWPTPPASGPGGGPGGGDPGAGRRPRRRRGAAGRPGRPRPRAGLARGRARPGRLADRRRAPVVLRATGLSTDDLAHDLATSPELDEPVAARAGRGA